jgi:hypothetical protein
MTQQATAATERVLDKTDTIDGMKFYADMRRTISLWTAINGRTNYPLAKADGDDVGPIARALDAIGVTPATVYPAKADLNFSIQADSFREANRCVLVQGDSEEYRGKVGRNQLRGMLTCLQDWSSRFAENINAINVDDAFRASSARLHRLRVLSQGHLKCEEMEKLYCSLLGERTLISSTALSATGAMWNRAHGALIVSLESFCDSQRLLLGNVNESERSRRMRASAIALVQAARHNLETAHSTAPVLSPLYTLGKADALNLASILDTVSRASRSDAQASEDKSDPASQIVALASGLSEVDADLNGILTECRDLVAAAKAQKQSKG